VHDVVAREFVDDNLGRIPKLEQAAAKSPQDANLVLRVARLYGNEPQISSIPTWLARFAIRRER